MGPVQLNALIRPYKEIDAEATQTLHNYCRHHLAAACHSSHLTPGVKWEDIGPNRPKRGREYLNEALVAKLRQGKVVVTREELACMAKEAGRTMPGTPQHCSQHNNISYDTFIKVGASYFAPSYPRLYTHSTGTGHDFAWRGSLKWQNIGFSKPLYGQLLPGTPFIGLGDTLERMRTALKRKTEFTQKNLIILASMASCLGADSRPLRRMAYFKQTFNVKPSAAATERLRPLLCAHDSRETLTSLAEGLDVERLDSTFELLMKMVRKVAGIHAHRVEMTAEKMRVA